jgi:hypothetical protein
MMAADLSRIDLDMNELLGYLEQARSVLGEDGFRKLKAALETLHYLTDLVGDKNTTIHRLRRIIFGPRTEKYGTFSTTKPGRLTAPAKRMPSRKRLTRRAIKQRKNPKAMAATGHGITPERKG